MITKKELENVGWWAKDENTLFYDHWEYQFKIKQREFWSINDGVGEPEFITTVDTIDELVELYWAIEGKEMKQQ